MIRTVTYFLLSATLICLAASCKKKGENEKLDKDNDPNSSFMSNKEGSWWLYGVSNGTINRRTATGRDSTQLDKVFNYYELQDTVTYDILPEYFGKNKDFMLMLTDIDGGQTNYALIVIYKEDGKVGDSWTNTGNFTFSGVPIQGKIEGRIESTGGSMTIGDKTYQEVTLIHNDLKAKLVGSPVYTDCGTAKLWFAKDIGIIKSDYDFHIASFFSRQYRDSLLDYHIVP